MNKKSLQFVLLIFLSLGFVFLATNIFMARFESGDLYPKYSTFRPDPFGSKVLLKSLDRLQNVEVDVVRDRILFEKETEGVGRVIFLLGLPVLSNYSRFDVGDTLDRLIEDGATVVLALGSIPVGAIEKMETVDSEETSSKPDDITIEETDQIDPVLDVDWVSAQSWLQKYSIGFFEIHRDELTELESGDRILAVSSTDYLRESLTLNQPIELRIDGEEEWTSLYEYNESVVAAELKLGDGRLILFSDSFPFSNEGLLNSANSELLAWIVKGKQRVSFYESHLGVEEFYGLIALTRLYGFDSALILFAFACATFVWRGTFSALPKHESNSEELGLIDIDAVDLGLDGLLRRSIDQSSICPAIYDRWKKSRSARSLSKSKDTKIEETLQVFSNSKRKPEDITNFYNATVAILEANRTKKSK